MPLSNCKAELSLPWNPNCVLCTLTGASTFTITNAKLYVPIVTLSTEDNVNIPIRDTTDSSCQGINRLFVLAYESGSNRVKADSHRRYFLPKLEIEKYNIESDGRNFYDQPINNQETNDLIKQYNELRKVSTVQGDGYRTGCLLNFAYFKKITD